MKLQVITDTGFLTLINIGEYRINENRKLITTSDNNSKATGIPTIRHYFKVKSVKEIN